MTISEKNKLVSIVLPIISFVLYGYIYQILVYINRLLLILYDSEILFYGSLIISNLIALFLAYFFYKKVVLNFVKPLKKFIVIILILLFVFVILLAMPFLVTEIIGSENDHNLIKYYQYLNSEKTVKTIFSTALLALMAVWLVKKDLHVPR